MVIPWSGRPELARTLEQNLGLLAAYTPEVLVVNCGGDPAALATSAFEGTGHVRTIDLPAGRFNKALALNLGLHAAQADTVLTLDADVLLNAETLRTDGIDFETSFFTVEAMQETLPSEQPLEFLKGISGSVLAGVDQVHLLRFTWADGTTSEVRTARKSLVDGNRAGAGLLMVRKAHLVAIGGYNSKLEHWGWEDNDIQFRLRHVLGLQHVERGSVQHISHGDELRAMHGQTRADLTFLNLQRSVRAFAHGDFQGTLHADVLAWHERSGS